MFTPFALEAVPGAVSTATEIVTSAMTTLKADTMAAIGAAAPVALSVGGAILVIGLGWKLFKRFSK